MSSTYIPCDIEEVTAGWLGEVCGFDVKERHPVEIGSGIGITSSLYRVGLTGDCDVESVIVKLPTKDEAALFTASVLRMYLREVGFFSTLAGECPVRVPTAYHVDADPETHNFVLVLEDMGRLRPVDQVAGMSVEDAERAVDGLALMHATWWRRARALAESGITTSLDDPIYPAILPMVFDEGWEIMREQLDVAESVVRIAERYRDAIPRMLEDLCAGPETLVHGDFRGDNLLFDDDGSLAMIDFQLIGTAIGAYDLAYFVTQSLCCDVAAEHESHLFGRWTEGLRSAGVPPEDLATAWDDYRRAALFCLIYPVSGARSIDFSDARQRGLAECQMERYTRAAEQLDLGALL